MAETFQTFIERLAEKHRVLMLGGHAVIFHGLQRETLDADIWLDPALDQASWNKVLAEAVTDTKGTYLWDLAAREQIDADELPDVVESFGVVRVSGLSHPLDVFRKPNNLEPEEFDVIWSNSLPLDDSRARVLEDIDLLVTKLETGREKDQNDLLFLEAKIRGRIGAELERASLDEAHALFARYADHATCAAALKNPHPEVQALALETLKEFAEQGNPFARELLAERGVR